MLPHAQLHVCPIVANCLCLPKKKRFFAYTGLRVSGFGRVLRPLAHDRGPAEEEMENRASEFALRALPLLIIHSNFNRAAFSDDMILLVLLRTKAQL